MGLDEIIKEITHETECIVNTKTLIGEPTTFEGKTIMPIMKVSAGFGSAGGENHQESGQKGYAGGGYAGVNMEPIGFVVISEEDVRLLTLSGRSSFNSIIDVIPELASRLPYAASRVKEAGTHMAEDVNKKIRERREKRSEEGKSSMTERVKEGAEKISQRVRDMQPEEGSMAEKVRHGAEEISKKAKDLRGKAEGESESESSQPFGEKELSEENKQAFGSRSMEEGGSGGSSQSFGGRGGA
ncbi:MAG: spore germination protein GerW family protein [Methanolobus sp.]|uniref:GerW family sporulation protein n=1 Tax=Methanolobus sp. TaxID=1874737 RepID=UPI002731D639|nr:spore germination protein GerW family protein [Methanolobus sp.]MDP2216818.1 spore germination protein GerW family protein [Methanolobus sp.]